MVKMNKLKIILSALEESKTYHDINDLDLSNKAGIKLEKLRKNLNSFKDVFKISSINKIECPNCGKNLRISSDIEYAYCDCSDEKIDLSHCPRFNIIVDITGVKKSLFLELESKLKSRGWSVEDKYQNNMFIRKDGFKLGVFLTLEPVKLDNYFSIRGWKSKLDAYVMVSQLFTPEITSYISKDLRCCCIGIRQIFNDKIYEDFLNTVNLRIKELNRNKEIEQVIKQPEQEYGNILNVKKYLDDIFDNIIKYAKQKGDTSASRQGKLFQKHVVSLFQLSLMKIKYLGGKNETDGMGYIFKEGRDKTIWCPFEIKTTKKEIYLVSKNSLQLRKYCITLDNSFVRQKVDVRYFILVSNDFVENDSKEIDVISELEKDYPFKFVRFPLTSILKMAELFIKDPPIYIPSEELESFFEKHKFIKPKNIEDLHKKLKGFEKTDSPIYKYIRERVSKYGT